MIRSAIERFLDRWTNLHSVVRFLALTATLMFGWVCIVKPGWGLFKEWRLERRLNAAHKALDEARMDDARNLSLTVLQAGDPRVEAFRILEKSTAKLKDPRHAEIARLLISHPDGNTEDRLEGFRGISRDVALGLVGQAWGMLPDDCHKDPRFAAALADRLLAERRFSEAESVLLAVPEAARTLAIDRQLVQVLTGSDKREDHAKAQRLIADRIPVESPESSGWLDLLEEIPAEKLQADVLDRVRVLLEKPASGDSARVALMLARLDYAANFFRRDTVLEMVIARWKDRDPERMARFLDDLGHYQLLLDTFPVERAKDNPGLFPYLFKAIQRRGAWYLAADLLNANSGRLPSFEESAYRAVVVANTKDANDRQAAWNAAMIQAQSSSVPTALLTLCRVARDAGMADEAGEAMVEAIRRGRGPLPLYENLKPLLTSLANQGRENTMLEICTVYLWFEPGNPVLLTQYAYLACMNHLDDTRTILQAMEILAKGYPGELPVQCVLATVYLMDNQYDKAAATLDRLDVDPAKLPPGFQAMFLTTQVLTHRLPKDDPRITEFPWKSLQPSERKNFSELIRTANP